MALCSRLFLLGLMVAMTLANYYEDLYESMKNEILLRSNAANLTWKVGYNPYFANMSEEEIKMRANGIVLGKNSTLRKQGAVETKKESKNTKSRPRMPDNFDSRKQWPNCKHIGFVKDQSNCGSCWAVSAASVMSDRLCIASGQKKSPFLSEEDIMSCCWYCGNGCHGGNPVRAFQYWVRQGVPTGGPYGSIMGCKPYSIAPCKNCTGTAANPKCTDSCARKVGPPLDKDKYYGSLHFIIRDELAMEREIFENGPIVAGFVVYSDFLLYKGGIYRRTAAGRFLGYHAVKIIGWGTDDRYNSYWLVVNSWNTTFGENGLFRIAKGQDECEIESMIPTAGYA